MGGADDRAPGTIDADGVLTGASWRAFCDRMAALGERILEGDFPGGDLPGGDERDRAEGVRHLANQMACWLTYELAATDPQHPALFTHNNLHYRWGGPNVDQNARRAVVAGDGVYRLTVTMNACEHVIIQLKPGNMHMGVKGVLAEVSSADLGIGPGESARIVIGGPRVDQVDGQPVHWVPLDPAATLLHVRDYYYDWKSAQPAMFALERLDTQGQPREPLTAHRVAGMLEGAAAMVENSLTYWNDWVERTATAQPANTFSTADVVEGGVKDIVYAFADVRLQPDQALVVEVEPDQARQWNAQLQSVGWFESLDFPNRTTCVNHAMAERRPDGSVVLVIAERDPGVPNWLDTEGRSRVFATQRWVGPREAPRTTARVVALDEVASLPGMRPVDAEERLAEVRRRASHVAWRFRA